MTLIVKNELKVAEFCSIFFPQLTVPELEIEKIDANVYVTFNEFYTKVAAKTVESSV
jgi:hypothetical protein